MSIEDGDNLRFNAAMMLCEAAEHELAAAKARRELAELKLKNYKLRNRGEPVNGSWDGMNADQMGTR